MTSIAYYFAGLATLPLLVIVLSRIFPKRTVDSQCVFCKRIKRFDSWEAAQQYAEEHIANCEKHPYCAALKRITEAEKEIGEP